MPHSEFYKHIRQLICNKFSSHGAIQTEDIQETILIKDGFYFGRRYVCNDLQATWFIEENQVKLRGNSGEMLEVFELEGTQANGLTQGQKQGQKQGQNQVA